jgi:4-methylaminobutanoate oxidase (formaldehyde-forming)
MGWERANYFAPGVGELSYTYGKPGWLPYCLEEQRATREAAAIFDQTSFAKFLLQGRDALALLQRLCANDMDVAPGCMVYTAMLNARGGFESDFTVIRLDETMFLLITGSGQATRDRDWISRHVGDQMAILTDVTSAWSVLSVMGPKAPELLARVSPDDLSEPALPRGATAEIDVGFARVRAARMSYVGGPGFELYVPTEFAAGVYDTLMGAGAASGLTDAGYYAIDALRIEAGRRAFGAELGPDETPLEAGLMHAVKLDKRVHFIGRQDLLHQRDRGPTKRLGFFLLNDPDAFPWGGEGIVRDGKPVGEVTSAGYSARLGRAIVIGYVRGDGPITREHMLSGDYIVDIAGHRVSAKPLAKPPFPG